MPAAELIFPAPRHVQVRPGRVAWPGRLTLRGEALPDWLTRRLALACERGGGALAADGGAPVTLTRGEVAIQGVNDSALLAQAYTLTVTNDAEFTITSPTEAGLRHAVITLCLLIEAVGAGATLAPMTITDAPAFRVRGIQIDMAREFFPGLDYLKQMIDRLADLKANTLWLYLENHLRVPGMEDISQKAGMTIDEAREVSAYGALRGIDVVPGTNVLSHMEGWFRLERYAHLSDGTMRSYPVLTRPEAWALVEQYLDAMADAFASPNFHAGLDELLFTGTNPEAQAAIEEHGKPDYFADFAVKVIDHLQSKGKTVWIWDDMVLGKNIHRKEGFGNEYARALVRIPRDVIMTHWYYWTDSDGKHGPIMKRVGEAGRPFVVAPSARNSGFTFPAMDFISDNQNYMAECGLKWGGFGYINTHWESRCGSMFESVWPCLALGMGYAWQGPMRFEEHLPRLSFTMTGEMDNALGRLLMTLTELTSFLEVDKQLGRAGVRNVLFLHGPHQLWRRLSPQMRKADWATAHELIAQAWRQHAALGPRDPQLARAMALPILFCELSLQFVAEFDRAWEAYHQAALIERDLSQRSRFHELLSETVGHIASAAALVRKLQRQFIEVQAVGHTPYDSHALGLWAEAIDGVGELVLAAAHDGSGLPYFEKLLYLPDQYHISNLRQLQVQNTFHARHSGLPWMRLKAEQSRQPHPSPVPG